MKNILIAPSLLSCDFTSLKSEIQRITDAKADILHLDIMDGHYVPNLTFGYVLVSAIRSITSLPLDAHLMVTNPGDYIDRLAEIGVQYISFHPDAVYHPHRLLHYIKSKGIKAGLALNPGLPLSSITELLPDADYVLLMSVNPGYSGQSFIPSITPKVKELKDMITKDNLSTLIQVDGGINEHNASTLTNAGADILVSASYIFSSNDYSEAIRRLKHV